jgi:glycosyltransferase involved in cell wall biosynthesis
MRVGLVIYGSLDTVSGGYLYDRKLVEEFTVLGHSISVFSLAYRDYTKHLADNLNSGWHQELVSAPVDLMLQDELNHPSLLSTNFRQRNTERRYPIVAIVHHLRSNEVEHLPSLRPLYRTAERLYLNSVDALLCNSETTRHAVEQLTGRKHPVYVAYPAADHLPADEPAVNLPDLAARSRARGPLRILFVGNIIQRKGLDQVLDALAQLPAGFWQLTVVGRQDANLGYTKLIRAKYNSFPQGAVQFLGRISDAELVAQYRTHHVLAVPSYEGFGIVYLEAMRFGMPVIASTLGAAREIVTHGENGFLVWPHDTRALSHYLYSLYSNRERLLAMSFAARRCYTHHPTWRQSMAGAAAWLAALPATSH